MNYKYLHISGDVTACDPGCNNTTCFEGSIAISDLQEGQRVDNIINSSYWHEMAGYKFYRISFERAEDDKVFLKYGEREIMLNSNKYVKIDHQPLSYAYAEMYAKLTNDPK